MSLKNNDVKLTRIGDHQARGQKPKRDKKVVIRIPENYIDIVKELINYLDECPVVKGHHSQKQSEKLLINSLQSKIQEVIFSSLISKK